MVIGDQEYDPEIGGEDDGLQETVTVETTQSVIVNTDHVRAFYTRKKRRDGTVRVGTRICFSNGGAMPVRESFDEVCAKFGRAN
jgi:hypothetical protein